MVYSYIMAWVVNVNRKVKKQLAKLPKKIEYALVTLIREIEVAGPVRGNWPNFGYLEKKKCYHCHLKKGKLTYVVLWKSEKGEVYVEVIYVGTHEKAPY